MTRVYLGNWWEKRIPADAHDTGQKCIPADAHDAWWENEFPLVLKMLVSLLGVRWGESIPPTWPLRKTSIMSMSGNPVSPTRHPDIEQHDAS